MDTIPDDTQGTEPEDTTVVPGAAEPEPQPEAGAAQPDPDAPGETPEPEPKPSGLEKRISKLVYQAREAERREAYWRGIAEAKGGPPPTPTSEGGAREGATDGPPKQEQFETYDLYIQAVAGHEIETRLAKERQRLTAELEGRELQGGFEKRVEAIRAKHEDFDAVAFTNDHAVSETMRDAILNTADGPEIAYWLGHNHEESNRIARLSPNHQILELGRISARLAAPPPAPPPRTASAAPAPIKPIRGSDGTFQKDPERMTDAEWWRSQKRSTR